MNKNLINELKTGICFVEVNVRFPVDIQYSGSWTGTGFIIEDLKSKKRYIATCAHVAPLTSYSVSLEFINGFRTKGKVAYQDHCHDVSFIEFEDNKSLLVHTPFKFEKIVSDFESLTLIGGNEGYKSYVSDGVVADSNLLISERNTIGIQSSIQSSGGTSGSPIFNQHGKIVGMHASGTERCSFEISSEVILDSFERFTSGKSKKESGVTLDYENKYKYLSAGLISADDNQKYFENTTKLIIVKDCDIFYDSYLHLMSGDVILKVNGILVKNAFHFEKILNDSAEYLAKIEFFRNGSILNTMIRLVSADIEKTSHVLSWEGGTFQNSNILTRRYYSIKEEGVLMSKCLTGSLFYTVGTNSEKIRNGKGTLVTHLNGVRVKNLMEFINVLKETQRESISLHFYDYILNVPHRFCVCDVKYEEISELLLEEEKISIAS